MRGGLVGSRARLPHARGGVSTLEGKGFAELVSSPRSWGCFQRPGVFPAFCIVFPTLVGVFPWGRCKHCGCFGLPHARGGVSLAIQNGRWVSTSSPRSWGCFHIYFRTLRDVPVFPTLVGVFLSISRPGSMVAGLPHARGGVSAGLEKLEKAGKSSPRSWGCFLALDAQLHGLVVFPTLVGVFPTAAPARRRRPGLPHARGGVSAVDHIEAHHAPSSPRSWGCFCRGFCRRHSGLVFPTLVGVFLFPFPGPEPYPGLPHARGGVSAS